MAEPKNADAPLLLILGASVRAAAQSAARAGVRSICGDLFADADLPNTADAHIASRFPSDLIRIADHAPHAPWMYTGGIENYPRLVARVTRGRELFGTPAEALERVRDPIELARVVQAGGFCFPECRAVCDGLPRDGSWLRKSRRSSGGLRVHLWPEEKPQHGRGWYYQRRIEGLPASAVYLAAAHGARLLGLTEQILSGSHPLPFQYAGAIGPLELSPHQYGRVVALGDLLSRQFGLRGLFGVDLVITADDICVIEVNPRYTASIEVLERALGFNAISLHIEACRSGRLPDIGPRLQRSCCGKSILYAERRQAFTAEMVQRLRQRNQAGAWPEVADIPRAGVQLSAGQPVLTVFSEAAGAIAVQNDLQKRMQCLRDEFHV